MENERIEISQSNGLWQWMYFGKSGNKLAQSVKPYQSRSGCINALVSVRSGIRMAKATVRGGPDVPGITEPLVPPTTPTMMEDV